jgi:hypothetical protein
VGSSTPHSIDSFAKDHYFGAKATPYSTVRSIDQLTSASSEGSAGQAFA